MSVMRNLPAFIAALREGGLDCEAWELADALWLSRHITPPVARREPIPPPPEERKPAPPKIESPESPSFEKPSSDQATSPIQSVETTVSVHIRSPAPVQTPAKPLGSRPFRAPTPWLLTHALALGRALRPLLRRVAARNRFLVDEAATVHHFAELEVSLPVLRGAPERWLELALVVDHHPSFVLWEPLLNELRRLLERHGAFRDLRLWRLGQDAAGKACIWPGLHGGTARQPKFLGDPEGRRVILLFSDFTAPAWWQGDYWETLRNWSRRQPVALLHLLPERLWRRTGLAVGDFADLGGVGQPGPINAKLRIQPEQLPPEREASQRWRSGLKLPILSLNPTALQAWSRLLAGRSETWTAGVVFPSDWTPPASADEPEPQPPDARLRLRRFRAGASPQAWDLARYCAAMPLTLPVARLVQATMLPDALPAHLAEVFLGGLLEKAEHQMMEQPAPLEIIYEFHDGVRQLLIDSLTPPQLLDVLQRVSRQVEERLGRPHDFLARLADPTVFDPDSWLAPDSRPFAQIKLQVLRRLGGEYGTWAMQLANYAPTPFRDRFLDGKTEGPEMVWLPGGTFTMGDDQSDQGNEKPAHLVTLSPFAIGKYPVTFEECDSFCEATDRKKPSDKGWGRNRRPVINISWDDAQAYCQWLSEQTGQDYRPLTEAQWEYACRAGSKTAYCFGDDEKQLGEYAWYWENAEKKTQPVGQKRANKWGLYDLHGNVWEWVQDWYRGYSKAPQINPINTSGLMSGASRVIRGGSWGYGADRCRSACRDWFGSGRGDELGFRLARLGPLPSYSPNLSPKPERPPRLPNIPIPGLQDTLTDGSSGPMMVWLPGGVFQMGQDDTSYTDEKLVHEVEVSAFSIGQSPVTFEEYDRFCAAKDRKQPHDAGWGRGTRPVIDVSWDDATAFCEWLSKQTGTNYRLPTEAEWEYACQAGSATRYGFGDDERRLGEYAWYSGNAGGKTHPVREKSPNAWQLYDLHGNVLEWVQDWHANDYYRLSPRENPTGPESGSARVVRGGSWGGGAGRCRSAVRDWRDPGNRSRNLGFRLARTGPWSSDAITLARRRAAEQSVRTEREVERKPAYKDYEGFRDRLQDGSEAPEMVYLPGGTFKMGDLQGKGFKDERPVHEVTLDAFAIGRYPVAVGEFRWFVAATGYQTEAERKGGAYVYDGERWSQKADLNWRNPYFLQVDNHPVVCMSWNDAAAYCEWLSAQTGECYSLPTEAEWEYACRAGSKTVYCFGNDEDLLEAYAWYSKNAEGKTHPVGQKRANAWGLHDLHGNVWEWVQDRYGRYSKEPLSNLGGFGSGFFRVFRGGSWFIDAVGCRSAARVKYSPGYRSHNLGFRLARRV